MTAAPDGLEATAMLRRFLMRRDVYWRVFDAALDEFDACTEIETRRELRALLCHLSTILSGAS